MEDVRIGRLLRALRRRKHLRQVDVAKAAGISQQAVSLIERGHLSTLSLRVVRLAFASVDARFDGTLTWRGGHLDRLLDQRHAELVGQEAQDLAVLGWQVASEVTFSIFGERGSIDLLAFREQERIVLVDEIKTELTAIDDTVRRIDAKDRLAARIVEDRFGWRPRTTARMIVLLDTTTNRRHVASNEGVLSTAFPDRGQRLRAWLRRPVGRISGLRFVTLRR